MFGLCYKGTLFAFNSVACGHVFAEITTFKYCGNERKQVILQTEKGKAGKSETSTLRDRYHNVFV